jgi:hypothetical protein
LSLFLALEIEGNQQANDILMKNKLGLSCAKLRLKLACLLMLS